MTDLEMTKLCAEAMEFPNIAHDLNVDHVYLYKRLPDTPEGDGGLIVYNPLYDDAQAMALVKRFKLAIDPIMDDVWAVGRNAGIIEDGLNRAIVECVAKMQAAK